MGENRDMMSSNVNGDMNGNVSSKLTAFFRQRQIGTLLGFMKIVVGNISPYATWVSLALIGVTSFYTTLSPVFQQHGIPLPFWLFCVVLGVVLVGMGLLEWVFMMPSFYKANNLQSWDAGGPLQDKISRMEKDIADIKKALNIKEDIVGTDEIGTEPSERDLEAVRQIASRDLQKMDKQAGNRKPAGKIASSDG